MAGVLKDKETRQDLKDSRLACDISINHIGSMAKYPLLHEKLDLLDARDLGSR
jgi:hypothetical protein